jgi:hypothetical protein
MFVFLFGLKQNRLQKRAGKAVAIVQGALRVLVERRMVHKFHMTEPRGTNFILKKDDWMQTVDEVYKGRIDQIKSAQIR